MQQVFTVMNSLLKMSKEAKQKKLNVRTYKVVPLTERSGVLEWCKNTLPIGVILHRVHAKYYPNDFSPAQCRELLRVKSTNLISIYIHK